MQEHTIPESLVEAIQSGRATLVVGSGVGVPSWKQLLERVTAMLASRGGPGDDAAVKDVEKLLGRGNMSRALAFLARALGEDAADKAVQEVWAMPDKLPEFARVLAELPFRHVWTTFPGEVIERAFAANSPKEWPPAHVATYAQVGDIAPRRRTLVQVLGDFDNYAVTPRSVRRILSGAVDLRDYVREHYVEGTLVFVGFRVGDPDLDALLERMFNSFEPPKGTHYFLGAGIGPVAVNELMADHHIQVLSVAAKAGDDASEKAVIAWLEALRTHCQKAGITLHQGKPDGEDLEGWLSAWADSPADARDALDAMERTARQKGDFARVAETLLGRIEHAEDAERAELLTRLAAVYESELGDLRAAFDTTMMACAMDPASTDLANTAERLASATGNWAELVNEGTQIATDASPLAAAAWWTRLGKWYGLRLDRMDYAIPAVRRALEIDATSPAAHATYCDLLRRAQKWSELGDALAAHADVATDTEQSAIWFALGELCEGQLAAPSRAMDAYQKAADTDHKAEAPLVALERLAKKDEQWATVAKVIERRAEQKEAAGDDKAAATLRRDLATLRAERLGDMEGAIARYEAAVTQNGGDLASLRALADLYDKTGRTDESLRTLERMVAAVPESDKLPLLRKLAAGLSQRDGEAARSRRVWEQILTLDASADDAYRGLETAFYDNKQFDELVALLTRHIAAVKSPTQKIELYSECGGVYETELSDPHRAIECHLNVLAMNETQRSSLVALARLYARTEQWDKAVDTHVRLAKADGDQGAAEWARAGSLAYKELLDPEAAEQYLEKALAGDAGCTEALDTLADVHQKRGSWQRAVDTLLRAESSSSNRLERVNYLWRAIGLLRRELGNHELAATLSERLLRLDPEHVEAGEYAVERWLESSRWDEAIPVLEMLARKNASDKRAHAETWAQLGHALFSVHRTAKAEAAFRAALGSAPDHIDAAMGLAATLMADAKAKAAQPGVEMTPVWTEVDKAYRVVLAKQRTGLSDSQLAEIWYQLGYCANEMGDSKKAEAALRKAREHEPFHEATLTMLVTLATAHGDFKTVVDVKRAMVESAPDARKAALLDEIGDTLKGKLRDTSGAISAYLEGLTYQPGSFVLLHKLLDIYSEQKDWRRAVDMLEELAMGEPQAERRAKYHYASAVIARDELRDLELAVEKFGRVLDDTSDTKKAFDAIDKLLSERGEWKALSRAYRKHLRRIGENADPTTLHGLWSRLGDICMDQLQDRETALAAYQVASELLPNDADTHEALAEIYLAGGESQRKSAIAELQVLVAQQPERTELYKTLSGLYLAEHEFDAAWCVAQTLVFLGAADPSERAFYEKHRHDQFVPAGRRLTEELWQKAVIHPGEDRTVGAIFASALTALAGQSAQPASAFGLSPGDQVRLESDSRPFAQMARYTANLLGLDAPLVWTAHTADGLRVANTLANERTRLQPSLLVGDKLSKTSDPFELAFDFGQRMAYLRPERFATMAMGSLPRLEAAFAAAVLASGASVRGHDGAIYAPTAPDVQSLAQQLRASVPTPLLEQVSDLSEKLSGRVGNGLVTGWFVAADHTANRAGLIACANLETAARCVATDTAQLSTASAKERLRQLVGYSASAQYITVRRHLGQHIRGEAST